jgi:hypothetical protein
VITDTLLPTKVLARLRKFDPVKNSFRKLIYIIFIIIVLFAVFDFALMIMGVIEPYSYLSKLTSIVGIFKELLESNNTLSKAIIIFLIFTVIVLLIVLITYNSQRKNSMKLALKYETLYAEFNQAAKMCTQAAKCFPNKV